MAAPKAGSPAQFTLSVAPGVPEEFARWREGVAPIFNLAPLSEEEQGAFTMETLGYFLPGLAITRTTSSPCTFQRTSELIARSGIDNILVQVYVAGSYRLTTGRADEMIEPGDIAVLDLACESTIEAAAYSNVACTLRRDLLEPMLVSMVGCTASFCAKVSRVTHFCDHTSKRCTRKRRISVRPSNRRSSAVRQS